MDDIVNITFGDVAESVCQEFNKFLDIFDGDVLSLLKFLINRYDVSCDIKATIGDKIELSAEVSKKSSNEINHLLMSFAQQKRLKSMTDAIEILVLNNGIEWKDSDEMQIKSQDRMDIITQIIEDRKQNKFCDLQVIVGGNITHTVHKCILAASSQYFASLLQHDTKRITILNMVRPGLFSVILDFIYSGEITLSKETCPVLLKLAMFFKFESLQRTCEDFLKLFSSTCESRDLSTEGIIVVLDKSSLNQDSSCVESSTKSHCQYCQKVFGDNDDLETHVNTAHNKINTVVTVIGEEPEPEDLQVEKKDKKIITTSGMPFTCNLCKSLFRSRSHLKRHMLSHTGERKHCCTTCGKLFLKADHLTRHERTHSTERPFQCDQCNKRFKTKDNLKRHQLTHSNERPFFCELCAKQFKDKGGLLIHQKSHSKSEPICPHCGKRFKQQNRLAYHVIRHNNPLTCKICGKTFAFQNHLRRHSVTHTGDRPFSCETCGRQFANAHGLKLHQKKHTGIGLHACGQCDRKFLDKFHLKRHMKTHTGEKPFKCQICERTFSRADNCESHKRTCVIKVAIRKDIQSYADQDGDDLKIKRIQKTTGVSTVDQTDTEVSSEMQEHTIQNIAIAVDANQIKNCRYRRINKRLPELKLVLLDDKDHDGSDCEDLTAVSINNHSTNIHHYPPQIDLDSIQQGKGLTFADVSKLSSHQRSTCSWNDQFNVDSS